MTSDESAFFGHLLDISNVEVIARFTVDGEPVSKSRARFTGYGSRVRAYTPERTKAAEESVGWHFRQAAPSHRPDSAYDYGLACVFFAGTRQRRDVDNMLKLISDALNGLAWADDVQVSEVMGRRGVDFPENARTEVLIYRLGERVVPTKPCEHCGQQFRIYKSTQSRTKFCSPECRKESRRQARTGTCASCGKEFTFPHRGHPHRTCSPECRAEMQRATCECIQCGRTYTRPKSWASGSVALCTHECQVAYWRAHPARSKRGSCIDCGAPVSRREYKRCRACSVKATPRRSDAKTRFDQEGTGRDRA